MRLFNDLAVPGLGGVWFGKQLLLATLGVVVAENARNRGERVQNIEVANAIEALACWLAFDRNDWQRDSRLRGSTKLRVKGQDFRFTRVRQRNFYVTQPMRMATVQALPALGFVEAGNVRFNSFCVSEVGKAFVDAACKACRPSNRSVVDHLTKWTCNQNDHVNTPALRQALSPLELLPEESRKLVRERLIQGGQESEDNKQRRVAALAWVEKLRTSPKAKPDWQSRPIQITDTHWHDLFAGAIFFRARDAAIAVLDALEEEIRNSSSGQFFSLKREAPEVVSRQVEALRIAATDFLRTEHRCEDAAAFCRECMQKDDRQILRALAARDGHVLRLVGDEIKAGPAFCKAGASICDQEGEEEAPSADGMPLPEGISYRMHNLYLLNLDLHGELSQWLNPQVDGGGA